MIKYTKLKQMIIVVKMNNKYKSIIREIDKLHKKRKELNRLEEMLYDKISDCKNRVSR